MPIKTAGYVEDYSRGMCIYRTPAEMCTCEHKRRLHLAYYALELCADDVYDSWIAHDKGCSIFKGDCCACDPEITLKTSSGEIQIDANGLLTPNSVN